METSKLLKRDKARAIKSWLVSALNLIGRIGDAIFVDEPQSLMK